MSRPEYTQFYYSSVVGGTLKPIEVPTRVYDKTSKALELIRERDAVSRNVFLYRENSNNPTIRFIGHYRWGGWERMDR